MRNILFSAALVMSLLYPALSASEDYRELAFASGLSAEVEVVQERERVGATVDEVATAAALCGVVGGVLTQYLLPTTVGDPHEEPNEFGSRSFLWNHVHPDRTLTNHRHARDHHRPDHRYYSNQKNGLILTAVVAVTAATVCGLAR